MVLRLENRQQEAANKLWVMGESGNRTAILAEDRLNR
jgi:hypothetical protein